MLPIDRITLYHGRMPCDLRFSYGEVKSFPFLIAEVSAGKWTGAGECLHGKAEEAVAFGRSLLGRDAFLLDALIPPASFAWQRSVFREMYSMALHDLAARAMGVPLHVLMGGLRRRRVPLMACLFPESPEHAERTARGFVDRGFKSLKVKNFGDADRDCALIRAVRRALPEGYLQSDPNCGYKSFAAAAAALPRMAEAGLTAVEDPGQLSLEEYRRLMEVSPRPKIILDAPSRGDAALGEIARLRPCDAVNLHPNMQGTFSEIRDRAAALRLAGLGVEVGGTGYTGVGAFAHLHVAAVYGEAFPFGELGGWMDHGMPARTCAAPLPIEEGCAIVPDTPGHGGELNAPWLAANAAGIEVA
jgi:L-alanine-DL-glutamate epimerase-like enolase superfamily enzyme